LQTAWGSREGADANDAERMRKRSDTERQTKQRRLSSIYPLNKVAWPPSFASIA
jgi:hypothetical protein